MGIGAGVESMSYYKIPDWIREDLLSKEALSNEKAMASKMSLGLTAENVS